MNAIKTAWNFIRDMLGFRKNSKYVKSYLNDANIKSSIYMSFIVIALEIWMIIRNVGKYVTPYWNNFESRGFTSNIDLLYSYTGLYVLFIICSIAVMMFAIKYVINKDSKLLLITNFVTAVLCILWPIFLIFEHINGLSVNSTTTLIVYLAMPLLGAFILAHTIYKKKTNNSSTILSMGVIVCFSIVCLAFGIKVGYSDYANPFFKADGVTPSFNRLKMITCFLTMNIFVACLLIWKPYFSIIMLTTIFVGFMQMLKNFEGRDFLEADEINYITFLISLTMVTISIYQQRITEAKKDELLIHDAIFDHLVDIHNMAYFNDTIKKLPLDEKKNSKYLFINIYNFRTINDQKGFDKGDEFLISFGKSIESIFSSGVVARIAADHFAVFTNSESLHEKIELLRIQVKDLSDGLFMLLKVGAYKYNELEGVRKSIDKARYACGIIKKQPELTYMEYSDEMNEQFIKRQYIVNHIAEAVENDWIMPYYQPVVWSKDHNLCGAEALARWIDPTYGFLSPADFIPVLEDTRLIHKLDMKIVDSVCKNIRIALDKGREVVPVSINFSRLDFELMDVVSFLEETLNKYNVSKKFIHVEITESALSNDEASLQNIVFNLREKGYAIWLDDFGSGYSSLNVLKDFVFDVIKIDMKFLSNFEKNEKTKDILDCIIQLATRLGMKTLTEGVETKEESEFLESIGCGRLQGYLFGKPYKLEQFEEKIDNKELIISNDIL